MEKVYLGDSVYVEINEAGQLVLTTENDIYGASNTIYLEPEVYDALLKFVGEIKGGIKYGT